jgi:hypothetical protein
MWTFYGTNFVFVYSERYSVVRASARVKSCSSDVHSFCSPNATAVILTIATLVLVMLLVNCPPPDFMCKARRVDWVRESRCHLVSVQIILVLREHKKNISYWLMVVRVRTLND